MASDEQIAAEVSRWRAEMGKMIGMVPFHLRDGLMEYCIIGRPVGGFLTAVLSNDLRESIARADENSLAGLKGLVQFLHNYSPPGCWGTRNKVLIWRNEGGFSGALRSGKYG